MKKTHIFYLILFSLFTTYKTYLAYEIFDKNNVPVYDGVMNEDKQIRSYMRYKDNFSVMERVNQVYYEFVENPLSAGFSNTIALINLELFINDQDIIIRSFLAVFIFSLVLFRFLKHRTSPINAFFLMLKLNFETKNNE